MNKQTTYMLGIISFVLGLMILVGYSQPQGEQVYWQVYGVGLFLFVLGAAQMALSQSEYPFKQLVYAFLYMVVGVRHTKTCLPKTYYSMRRREGMLAIFRWQYAEGLEAYEDKHGRMG